MKLEGGRGQFADETAVRMGNQSATATESFSNSPQEMQLYDIDEDGDADLITADTAHISATSPLVYLNDGSGNFSVLDPELFTGGDEYYG